MKHRLPTTRQLIRTDYRVLRGPKQPAEADGFVLFRKEDGRYVYLPPSAQGASAAPLPAAVVPADAALEEVASAFGPCPFLLVEDGGELAGCLACADVLQAVVRSYRYLNAYFETTLRTMNEAIALTLINEETRVAYWTAGAERLYAIRKEEIIGHAASEFFPADRLQSLKSLQTGESAYRQQHRPRPDMFVLINASPVVLDGRIIGAVAAETDITTEIRLHQELLQMTSKVQRLQQEVAMLSPDADPFRAIIGTGPATRRVVDAIRKISTTKATVLIQGESGTGKELFAKAIHDARESAGAPFIAINCGAIPASLFESELFGYERGAFSGADPKGKKGMIELAGGGTLFLDEIGEMPLDLQVKLLRVLQEKKYYPVGGTRMKPADCRIVAATNRDLKAMIAEGRFREDLYYRLNVVSVDIPPLRERKEDLPELTQAFLHEFSLIYDRPIRTFPHEVVQDLMQYDWPGNIRELRNAVERLVIFSTDGEAKREYLPSSVYGGGKPPEPDPGPGPAPAPVKTPDLAATTGLVRTEEQAADGRSFGQKLDDYERELLRQALEAAGGNKQAMAKELGVSRATLYNRMKRLGL